MASKEDRLALTFRERDEERYTGNEKQYEQGVYQNHDISRFFPTLLVKIICSTNNDTQWQLMCLMFPFNALTWMELLASKLVAQYHMTLP